MSRRLATFAAISLLPTAIDVGLLVLFRQRFGWPLLIADLVAIGIASVVSYGMHRVASFGSDPYYRWVRFPSLFAMLAFAAAVVDAAVLRITFIASGYTTVGGLLAAKALALSCAIVMRVIGYRYVLQDVIVAARERTDRPLTDGSIRCSVVIPAYRAADQIGATVRTIHDALADIDADGGLEVVVVDDGSGDATSDVALAAGAEQVITLAENQGKGGAVRAGMLATRGRTVMFTDADLAYDPPHLRRLLDEIESGWDVVIGNRLHRDSVVARASGLRAFGSRVINRLSYAVLLAAPRDTQCGLKGFRGDVARAIFARTRIDGFAFDIEVLHLVERAEWSLHEIPVELDEADAPSTVRVLRDVRRLVIDLFRVRRWSSIGAYDALDEVAAVDG